MVVLVFSKIMKIDRFYKLFCVSGDFLSQDGPWQQRPAHVHLEQGFPECLGTFGGSKRVSFLYSFFQLSIKNISFYCRKSHYWGSLFSRLFSNYFHENSKMRLRGAPKY